MLFDETPDCSSRFFGYADGLIFSKLNVKVILCFLKKNFQSTQTSLNNAVGGSAEVDLA